MNHYLATYIDFIQGTGFIILIALIFFIIIRKLFIDDKKDNHIDLVKIKVDD